MKDGLVQQHHGRERRVLVLLEPEVIADRPSEVLEHVGHTANLEAPVVTATLVLGRIVVLGRVHRALAYFGVDVRLHRGDEIHPLRRHSLGATSMCVVPRLRCDVLNETSELGDPSSPFFLSLAIASRPSVRAAGLPVHAVALRGTYGW